MVLHTPSLEAPISFLMTQVCHGPHGNCPVTSCSITGTPGRGPQAGVWKCAVWALCCTWPEAVAAAQVVTGSLATVRLLPPCRAQVPRLHATCHCGLRRPSSLTHSVWRCRPCPASQARSPSPQGFRAASPETAGPQA